MSYVFFIKKKELVESENYIQAKEMIRRELFAKKSKNVIDIWIAQEATRHYLKYFYERNR